MVSKWRHLIWAVPLGFVALILVLVWHQDHDFWRSTPALMRLAQDAARRGDYSEAVELARKAMAREPKNAQYALELGRIHLAAGQPQLALNLSRQLSPQDARSSPALTLQARALDLLGDRQAALDLLTEGLKDNPDDPEMLAVAATLAAQGNYDRPQAITCYEHLYQLSQRVGSYELLLQRIQEHQLPQEAFQWYLDLRKFGGVPHSGFGMGIERVVAWVCGLEHVRETIPFPRMLHRMYP